MNAKQAASLTPNLPPTCGRCGMGDYVSDHAMECRICGNPLADLLMDAWRELTTKMFSGYGSARGSQVLFYDGSSMSVLANEGNLLPPEVFSLETRLPCRMVPFGARGTEEHIEFPPEIKGQHASVMIADDVEFNRRSDPDVWSPEEINAKQKRHLEGAMLHSGGPGDMF